MVDTSLTSIEYVKTLISKSYMSYIFSEEEIIKLSKKIDDFATEEIHSRPAISVEIQKHIERVKCELKKGHVQFSLCIHDWSTTTPNHYKHEAELASAIKRLNCTVDFRNIVAKNESPYNYQSSERKIVMVVDKIE